MDPELWFENQVINFINMCMKPDTNAVKQMTNLGKFGSYSIMGGNVKNQQSFTNST